MTMTTHALYSPPPTRMATNTPPGSYTAAFVDALRVRSPR